MHFQPSRAILELGPEFYDVVEPARFPKQQPRFLNQNWAARVGLLLNEEQWQQHFARFEPLRGSLEEPLALRYHGHQFQSYNPELGDGRGFLFAQLRDEGGRLLDLGTKGSGTTPYSRRGDGRLTLKGAMREALATEMLESLGVNTSKTFSFFETGEALERGDEPSPTRSAVLTRLSHSHVRYGTFQRLAFLNKDGSMNDEIRRLVDYCARHLFPSLERVNERERPAAFFHLVVKGAAELCASWMIAGFVHGVLNTDNMNVTGESFDYGPYRFLPHYDLEFTAAYFDRSGLYAWGRQPETVIWNLERLAECLLTVAERETLVAGLSEFTEHFNLAAASRLRARLGLADRGPEKDDALISAVFGFMRETRVGFEQFFHDWHGGELSRERAERGPEAQNYLKESFATFADAIRDWPAAPEVPARLKHDYFAQRRPCSLLIDEIEWIWDAIAKHDDWSKFENKIEQIREMGQVYGRR